METSKTRLKEVLAIVNNKGGVGKTTTVQNLAAAMVREHQEWRVLVIDLDPQMHLSILHGWNQSDDFFTTPTIYSAMRTGTNLPVYKTNREGVYLVPGDMEMQDVDSDLFRQMSPKKVLQKCFCLPLDDHTGIGLTDIIESFDYVLIDCPPALSQSTYNAMAVATGLLVPVQMEGLSVNGLGNIILAMREVQSELNKNLQLRGLLPTMVDARPKIARGFIDYLERSYKGYVCRTKIRRSVKMNESQTMTKDIYQYRPYSAPGIDYEKLCMELFT